MSNLFISHSSRDNAAAKELQARLEEQGHRSMFLDLDPEAGIQAGVSWERTLYTKLRACRAVVALCSDSYLASQWCFAEIALARMEGKELFVLQIDPWSETTQMPSILTEEQFIDLRTNKDDGYQRLWNGFKVKGIVAAEAREWKLNDSPYPGLRAFGEEDAPIFFGRDDEIREGGELLNRVRRQGHPRLVMVLGSSGSGKSSLARAGIVPQLRRDRRQWLVVKPFRLGRQPARELAASLSQAFDEAGQVFAWEDIHRWLEPAAGGDVAAPAAALPAAAEAEFSPTVARERLLKALSAMEGELTAADDQIASSVRRLKDYLGKQQTETPLYPAAPPPPSVASPLAELASRLRLQGGHAEAAVVLVIDQFEELLGHDAEHPASRFLAILRAAMEAEDSPLLVIGTMRSDYLGVFQISAPLQGLGFKSLSVGPMSRDGMRQIIEEPAKLGQIQLENGLSDLLLEDTRTSDALPLLAFTLRMMWDRYHDKRLLEISEYKKLGGLQGAIAQVAEDTFEASLEKVRDKASRDALARELRDAFLSMARPATEGSGWARQPASWDQFSEKVRPALGSFIDQRLLVKRQDGTVEVAHEALFRSWGRLRAWLDEDREFLLWRKRLADAKREWERTGRDPSVLLSGPALTEARNWLGRREGRLEAEERALIQASVRLDARRRRRNFLLVAGSLIFLFLVAVGGIALWQSAERARQLADEQREQAESALKFTFYMSDRLKGLEQPFLLESLGRDLSVFVANREDNVSRRVRTKALYFEGLAALERADTSADLDEAVRALLKFERYRTAVEAAASTDSEGAWLQERGSAQQALGDTAQILATTSLNSDKEKESAKKKFDYLLKTNPGLGRYSAYFPDNATTIEPSRFRDLRDESYSAALKAFKASYEGQETKSEEAVLGLAGIYSRLGDVASLEGRPHVAISAFVKAQELGKFHQTLNPRRMREERMRIASRIYELLNTYPEIPSPAGFEWQLAVVNDFLRRSEGPVPERVLPLYADRVAFLKWKGATKEQILNDKRTYFQRWPEIHFTLIDDVAVKNIGQIRELSFDYQYDTFNRERGDTKSGIAKNVLQVRQKARRWVIVSEQQPKYFRE
jgi:hypothetical protein